MTELEKDLEKAIKELAISVKYPGCIWVDTEIPGQQVEISVSNIAARLAELGYMKVVRCGECEYEHSCDRRLAKSSWGHDIVSLSYCTEGERVVAKNATGEEVPNA